MLQVESTRIAGVAGLKVSGEVDHENADRLGGPLHDLIKQGQAHPVLDLREVDYVDGAGLSVLLTATELLPPGGRIDLVDPRPDIQRILELSGLAEGPRCHVVFSSIDRGDTKPAGAGEARPSLGLAPNSSP